jgi:hypothetical protein
VGVVFDALRVTGEDQSGKRNEPMNWAVGMLYDGVSHYLDARREIDPACSLALM